MSGSKNHRLGKHEKHMIRQDLVSLGRIADARFIIDYLTMYLRNHPFQQYSIERFNDYLAANHFPRIKPGPIKQYLKQRIEDFKKDQRRSQLRQARIDATRDDLDPYKPIVTREWRLREKPLLRSLHSLSGIFEPKSRNRQLMANLKEYMETTSIRDYSSEGFNRFLRSKGIAPTRKSSIEIYLQDMKKYVDTLFKQSMELSQRGGTAAPPQQQKVQR